MGWNLIRVWALLVYVFMFLPVAVVVLLSFNASQFGSFPMTGLSVRWFVELWQNEAILRAFRTSIVLGLLTAAISTTLGVLENMRFLGARSDVPALLASADIAVSASHEEGFSNAVTEAMAAARPVVATAAGGNAEAVTDGVTGFVVPVRDEQAMGRALLTLALDPELARNMGAAGRERVARELGMEECVLRHERLYEAVLAGRPVAEALSTAPATPAASEPRAGGAD